MMIINYTSLCWRLKSINLIRKGIIIISISHSSLHYTKDILFIGEFFIYSDVVVGYIKL
jgi:hypothetical protein